MLIVLGKFKGPYLGVWSFLFWIIFPSTGLSQNWEFNKIHQVAYNKISNLEIPEALSLLDNNKSQKDYSTLYLISLAETLHLITTENRQNYKSYFKTETKRLSTVKNGVGEHPHKLFFQSEIRLHNAYVHIKFGNYWKAVYNLRQAYKLIEGNVKAYPEFTPNLKTLGTLQVIFGTVPQKYQWIVNFFGIDGSIKEGIENLEQFGRTDHMQGIEAVILIAVVNAFLLQDFNKATDTLKEYYENNHSNGIISYLFTVFLIKNSKSDEALSLIKSTSSNNTLYNIPFIHYHIGEIYLQKGEYQNAIDSYQKFLRQFTGFNLIKDTYYKIALAYWLLNERSNALVYADMARNRGITVTEADKHADRQLNYDQLPNPIILKIRLLTDGGYYDQAGDIISKSDQNNFNQLKDKVEFTYRIARLAHKTIELETAIKEYLETIDKAKNHQWYFAPNSCLQLGYIYLKLNKMKKAKFFFKKATEYKRHEYKTSIDNNAKIALKSLQRIEM